MARERERTLPELEDPAWGPVADEAPAGARPLGAWGSADAGGVSFAGARIDTLLLCGGAIARPGAVRFGSRQARRSLTLPGLLGIHVVFAPVSPRPLLLGLVRLLNVCSELIYVEYTETWDVGEGSYRPALGACERRTPHAIWALADASAVVRAVPPGPSPRRGLALDIRIALPPSSRRELCFAYVRCTPPEEPAGLVRAFRGDVLKELERTFGTGH